MPSNIKKSFEKHVEECRIKHNNRYDYPPNQIIKNNKSKIKIICKEHGIFSQSIDKHKSGSNCPKCVGGVLKTKEEFILEAKIIHLGIKYDKVDYINSQTKVILICEEHGEFQIRPNDHLNGKSCRKCGIKKSAEKRKKLKSDLISLANKKHDFKFDYGLVDFNTTTDKVNIRCPKHGLFEQSWIEHYSGKGCKKCSNEKLSENKKLNNEEFIRRSIDLFGDTNLFDKLDYKGNNIEVTIFCKKHKCYYNQKPSNHFLGQKGCKKCSKNGTSNREIEVQEFVKSLGFDILSNKKGIIGRKEIDIYIPSLNKAIEFNGQYWHYNHANKNCKPKGYHAMKSNLCRKKGIKLLHVREDLYTKDKNKMLEVIKNFLENN